jgi:hypothetical protein
MNEEWGHCPPHDRHDLEHLARLAQHLEHGLARERTIPSQRLLEQVVARVRGAHQVGREHEKRVAHVALDVLGHLREVAQADRIRGQRDARDGVEGAHRGHQVARGADAAHARGDDEPVQGAATDHDSLEAPKHGARAERLGHHAPLDLRANLQLPLDTVHGNADGTHRGLLQTRVRRFRSRVGAAAAAIPL